MTNKQLTFIIVTFNSSHIIYETLAQINQQKYQIIIVDNNSSDNTIAIVKKSFPQVKIIANNKNLGFARANNLGFSKVNTKFSCILNADCFIKEDSITKILDIMNHEENIAIANAVAYSGSFDQEKQQIIQGEIDKIAIKNYLTDHDKYHNIKFASGCCMFIQTKIFKKIGLFDKNFFLYCEDNEICKRVLKHNYQITTVKDTSLIHLSQQSSNLNYDEKMQYFLSWHKLGWSKCYYTQAVHNKFIAKLKAIRNIIRILSKLLINQLTRKSLTIAQKAILAGCFAYLCGIKAFDKDDQPQKYPY
jgi:GT2 family glycosyltransferase